MGPCHKAYGWSVFASLVAALATQAVFAETSASRNKSILNFSWSNPTLTSGPQKPTLPSGLVHGTFTSPSMGIEVGYFIYTPPGYSDTENALRRYPVVFHLHGGRPGGEHKSVGLSRYVDAAIRNQIIPPTLYVYPNGGPMSWYNVPNEKNSMGEDVFVKELIPHIDDTYRTLGTSAGRALEGFSQGGRGTTRIMFKYPELFCSAAPGGSGYEPEKRIQEKNGYESPSLQVLPLGNNAWDLAKVYAAQHQKPHLAILLWVGTQGFNYEYNLKFSAYLKTLDIPHEMLVVEGVPHSASELYEKQGTLLMQFHQKNFRAAQEAARP